MNQATRAAQQVRQSATTHLPIVFGYPPGGIIGRIMIGTALLALGGIMLLQSGAYWTVGGIALGLFGGLVAASNLRALIDRRWRQIVINADGVEIRYGLSRRHYRFLDYSEYRISRLGFRRFLTALPLEVDRALGARARRIRVTLYDRPAFITPMPLFGDGAPASLPEWQSMLNELRRAAFVSAGLAGELDRAAGESAEEARNAAVWQVRARAGAKPSRLSRGAYTRGRIILGVLFFVILLGPMGLAFAVKHSGIVICGPTNGSACHGIDPAILQIVMIGGPLLAVLVFVIGNARMIVRRAHDLDEDLPYWRAVRDSLSRRGALQRRLGREEGTAGTNRFGPAPTN